MSRGLDVQYTVYLEAVNSTDTLAFFNRIRVWQPGMTTLLAPAFYLDNYFSLLAGEGTSRHCLFQPQANADLPVITLTGWNSGTWAPDDVVPIT